MLAIKECQTAGVKFVTATKEADTVSAVFSAVRSGVTCVSPRIT